MTVSTFGICFRRATYTGIKTNLLFFAKGQPTRDICTGATIAAPTP